MENGDRGLAPRHRFGKKAPGASGDASLQGQARANALEVNVVDLNKDDGLDTLLEQLDTLFLRDKVDLSYAAYSDFEGYRSDPGTNMADFVVEFERRYNVCKKYEMTLPDAVLSFKLLYSANLTTKDRQLALTAAPDLKYETMKSALKRIFGSTSGCDIADGGFGEASGISVKHESALYTRQYNKPKFFPKKDDDKTKIGTNPLNRFGKRSQCSICRSVFHWAKDCEHRTENVKLTDGGDKHENCNIALHCQETTHEIFMTESYGAAVIDTACTRTVCGREWLDNYMEHLNDEEKSSVVTEPSDRTFRFGDGAQVKSTMNVVIPAVIGDTECKIDTEVVDVDLPLLLSKTSLKKAKTHMDIENDKVTMFDKPIKLEFTSSGHYIINVQKQSTCANNTDVEMCENELSQADVLLFEDANTEVELQKVLTKLHKQFGHASADRLEKLIASAGTRNPDVSKVLRDVTSKCDICLKHNKPPPKPAVGLPMASEFNETVAVDLHELGKSVWYLHIMDQFTRFSAGAIIRSKQSAVFVEKFMQHWVGIFGAPKKLFSDNGGEFNNKEVHDMCENFNIEVKTTAAFSPWCNGTLERHNQTLTSILLKVKADKNCSWETALTWALVSKKQSM
jgi:hypothetical protein